MTPDVDGLNLSPPPLSPSFLNICISVISCNGNGVIPSRKKCSINNSNLNKYFIKYKYKINNLDSDTFSIWKITPSRLSICFVNDFIRVQNHYTSRHMYIKIANENNISMDNLLIKCIVILNSNKIINKAN